jgi:hypothetical protein
VNALEPERGPSGPPAHVGRATGLCGLAVLWWLALAGTAQAATPPPLLARPAGDAFRLDATFWSLARGGATPAALMGPPTRVPRRAPSLDPVGGEAPAEQPPPEAVETPAEPAPSTPPGSVPSASPASPVVGPVIPAPTAIPQPSSDDLEGVDANATSSQSASAEDIARSLPRESTPLADNTPEPVDEGPQRFIRGRSVPPFWIDRSGRRIARAR